MQQFLSQVTVPTNNIPEVDLNATAIGNILGIVFIAVGGLAVLFLLIGAARYVGSGGDQGAVKQAKDTIMYAIIGIVVSLSGFAIVQLVVGVVS